ncbi:MAG TPA: PHP domain-containing protein [Candidatus Thermoplasmatota archaeon]|nr:PHP domain-containing protein [Candidatus Thermoplasmatota archaeon]
MKADVVDLLVGMGLARRLEGDEQRARAYLRAANEIARTDEATFEMRVQAGDLRAIRGVGPSIERTIRGFLERGRRPERLPSSPEVVSALSQGIAPSLLWQEAPLAGAPDLHCHTNWSDGVMTLDELAAYAKRLGQKAIGVSDHSGSLAIARGLAPHEVRAQWAEIDRVQSAHPELRILKGTECDILADGTLDHPSEILRGFDYVIGSLHSKLRDPEPVQTERVLTALAQSHLTILGHPTTRVPGRRPPANLDLDEVFAEAARRGIALEVNGNPGRMDLEPRLAAQALSAGARLSLGSDAHYPSELYALATARGLAGEAGARPRDIRNFDFV